MCEQEQQEQEMLQALAYQLALEQQEYELMRVSNHDESSRSDA